MDVLKIFAVGIIGTLLYTLVKQYKPEYAPAVQTGTVLVIFIFAVSYISVIFSELKGFAEAYGIESGFIGAMVKALGVAVISQVTADLCRDNGNSSAGTKIEFAGRLLIITIILPILKSMSVFALELLGG